MPTAASQRLALEWIRRHVRNDGTVSVSDRNSAGYPEVTGYMVPALLACGERTLALRLVSRLIDLQEADGSYLGSDGIPYVFDTAQVLRGLLAAKWMALDREGAIVKASQWLLQGLERGKGEWPRPSSPAWTGVPSAVLLYALPPLTASLQAQALLERHHRTIRIAVRRYKHQVGVRTNSHFQGYIATGLIELGFPSEAMKVLRQPATPTLPATGQLAQAHFLLGRLDSGAALLREMLASQRPSGGWTGGAPIYFESAEVSWAPKFYLDACAAYRRAWFDANASVIPQIIDPEDERVLAVRAAFAHLRRGRFLDAGSGRGRYLRQLIPHFPGLEFHASDPSPELLRSLPLGVQATTGELTNLPYPDGHFDGVICIEALEHAVFISQALAELQRVTKAPGRILIIDKDLSRWGQLPTLPWEEWFSESLIGTTRPLAMEHGLFRQWIYDRPPQ